MIKNLFLIAGALGTLAVAGSATPWAAAGDLVWEARARQGAVDLEAKYEESPEHGLIDQVLEVELQHVQPNTEVFLALNGERVCSFTSDASGHARIRLEMNGVTPDADGRPDGPRIETGDVITAYRGGHSISATFQPRF